MAALLKPGSGPLDYGNRLWLKILFVVIYVMLYVPIITLIAFSFNTDKRGIVWRGFTLDNYAKAWNNGALIEAMIIWPLTSLGFVLTALAAKYLNHEEVSPLRWCGILLIVAGASLVSWSEKRSPATTPPPSSATADPGR